jgi:hypothetical protein
MPATLRLELVHPLAEAFVAASFVEVDRFVNEDEFRTRGGLFDRLQIQPDPPGVAVAGAPAGLHLSNANLGRPDAGLRLPLGQQGRRPLAQASYSALPPIGRIGPTLRVHGSAPQEAGGKNGNEGDGQDSQQHEEKEWNRRAIHFQDRFLESKRTDKEVDPHWGREVSEFHIGQKNDSEMPG